ncbi:MAG: hypothetical protein CMJ80_00475 [Planctomycetaceae bacterium]|nr:hypothetical protein [Planctomycetaceae bacterium]
MNMNDLTKLGKELECSKSILHLYTEFYGRLLLPFRELYTDVLEIGVQDGRSLLLWSKFFPNATICGIENLLYHKRVGTGFSGEVLGDDRIDIYIEDAYQSYMIETLGHEGKNFDLILDDGSHKPKDQLFMLNNYVDLLKQDGMLLIEGLVNMGAAYFVAENFTGDKTRLSIIDRRLSPTPRSVNDNEKEIYDSNFDEIILIYM